MSDQVALPKTLPENPTGWTKHLIMHLNFGPKGGTASYSINDADGHETPIVYQYDTRKGGVTGFTLPGIDPPMTWPELREMWPIWIKKQSEQKAQADGLWGR